MNAKIPKTLAQTEFLDSEGSNSLLEAVVDALYPVGSIYLTIGELPDIFEQVGTWVQIAEGSALWTATSDGGGTIPAGLPNITGTFGTARGLTNKWGVDGGGSTSALYDAGQSSSWNDGPQYSSDCKVIKLGFNAQRSNSIYGNSTTVQPPAYKVYAWRRTS